ncbi:MAG: tetratricopeptide repeat protein [Spirochaetes bacterium]|nr:tetratricopeptide repeat protein [Spirochaetota bacterium]
MSIIKISVFFIIIQIFFILPSTAQESRSWQYFYTRGMLQFKAEMYDYAIHSMTRALELNPELYRAANCLADIYLLKGKQLQSLQYLETSLAINDRQDEVHNKIGELYEFFEDRERSYHHFQRAVSLNPSHLMANLNLVRFCIRKGDPVRAGMHFDIAVKSGRSLSEPLIIEAGAAERRGDRPVAMGLYLQSLKANPAELRAYERLFELYRSTGSFGKAAAIMERLVHFKPDYRPGLVKLGYLYYSDPLPGRRDRRLVRSIACFREALKQDPGNQDYLFTLAALYRLTGKQDEAEKTEAAMKAARELKK